MDPLRNPMSVASALSTVLDEEHETTTANLRTKRKRLEKINYPKKRVSVACEICRSRKTRCDAKKPTCSFCAESGAQCLYRRFESEERVSDDVQVPTTAGPTSLLEEHEIISRLDRIERLLQLQRDDQQRAAPEGRNSIGTSLQSTARTPRDVQQSLNAVIVAGHSHPPMTVGIGLDGLSRLFEQPCAEALAPLCQTADDFEEQLEIHLHEGETMYAPGYVDIALLNLTTRRCWQLQQVFTKDVLPWCPIIDPSDIAAILSRTMSDNFSPYNFETCLSLFVLALGAFAEESHHLENNPDQFPGIDYFRAACQLVDSDRRAYNTILYVQAHVFMSLYHLYALRPVQAFEAIHCASKKMIILMQLRTKLSANPTLREQHHRGYWACYLIEHELQGYVPFSALLLQTLHDEVPLPTSDYDEPGIYWFVSEIALRRIFMRPKHGIGWNMHVLYQPVIADEMASLMAQWQTSLPQPVKWQLEDSVHLRPLLDPQKVFLRAQYYAITAILYWQHVVRLLTPMAPSLTPSLVEEREYTRVRDCAAKSLRDAVTAIFAVESLIQNRHVMLVANLSGLYGQVMLLLCTFGVPELESIKPLQRREAVILGLKMLKYWERHALIRKLVEKVEGLMSRFPEVFDAAERT